MNICDFTAARDGLLLMNQELNKYDINDIYNLDETALFFRLEPYRTLATTSGIKGSKN